MVAFPNPAGLDVYAAAWTDERPLAEEIGDVWDAARVAGVQPGTIRVWMTRGKIAPIVRGEGGDLFHLPTIRAAAAAGRSRTPRDPAANGRGPHRRRPQVAADTI